MNNIEKLANISSICASKKRLIILQALNENIFLGYSSIREKILQTGLQIGSTEVYKHTNVLIRHDLIEHIENKFIITKKGKDFVKGLHDLMKVFEYWDISGD